MKFMLLCYDDQKALADAGEAGLREAMDQAVQITHEMHTNGHYLLATPLHPVATATSVRIRDGKRMITDGPFAETREVLGGFFLIDVASIEEALEYAARLPGARFGAMEVRPVREMQHGHLARAFAAQAASRADAEMPRSEQRRGLIDAKHKCAD